jgi:hypothetical protein
VHGLTSVGVLVSYELSSFKKYQHGPGIEPYLKKIHISLVLVVCLLKTGYPCLQGFIYQFVYL